MIKWILIFVAFLTTTFYAGYERGKNSVISSSASSEVVGYSNAYKKTVEGAIASYDTSNRIENEVKAVDTAQVKIAKTVKARISSQINKTNEGKNDEGQSALLDPKSCGKFYFDSISVRLLNDARQGTEAGLDAAVSGNEEVATATSIGIEEFVANDLEIIRMYHDLAKRHDELVDAVEKHIKEQGTK